MDTLHPPYASGALTVPRMLNRWLDVNSQNGPLQRVMTYITLPVFNATVSWNGYSDIVTSFNVEAPNNFSFSGYLSNVPAAPTYALCVSYRVQGVVTRYLVWDAAGSNFSQIIPPYTGQPLLKNFRFEVWSTSQGNISQTASINFYTSVAGSLDYRYGTDSALAGNDGQVTVFTSAGLNLPLVFAANAVSKTN